MRTRALLLAPACRAAIALCVAWAYAASPAGAAAPGDAGAQAGVARRPAGTQAPQGESACIACHRVGDEPHLRKPVQAWPTDVHAAAGLGCESCHGGDPRRMNIADSDAAADFAMDPAKGFKPPPGRLEVPQFCARCHSDAAYMKRFNPQARVDQLIEYRTSVHGKLNAKGDENPATCIDCHGAHGIRPVRAPDSPVFATNVPKTCARCHSDVAKMAPYKIPTNQYTEYQSGVHGAALLEGGDTAAPACNDCHGNHGAAPPEVKSVVHVCGTCHAREAGLYQASFKKEVFEDIGAPECIACHGNHRIRHPTPELFYRRAGPEVSAGRITGKDPFSAELGDLGPGARVTASWRNVLIQHLDSTDVRYRHVVEVAAEGAPPIALPATVRPGVAEVPAPARVVARSGLTAILTIQPLSGVPVRAGDALLYRLDLTMGASGTARGVRVRDIPGRGVDPIAGPVCFTCHEPGDSCDVATGRMYASLSSLDRDLRAAATVLRSAELKGMDVTAPSFELRSKGTTAEVEARALIHSFDVDRLVRRAAEGRLAAAAARAAGKRALEELEFRRKGLAVSLVLVVLVLIGLYLKIREIDRRRDEDSGRRVA